MGRILSTVSQVTTNREKLRGSNGLSNITSILIQSCNYNLVFVFPSPDVGVWCSGGGVRRAARPHPHLPPAGPVRRPGAPGGQTGPRAGEARQAQSRSARDHSGQKQ